MTENRKRLPDNRGAVSMPEMADAFDQIAADMLEGRDIEENAAFLRSTAARLRIANKNMMSSLERLASPNVIFWPFRKARNASEGQND